MFQISAPENIDVPCRGLLRSANDFKLICRKEGDSLLSDDDTFEVLKTLSRDVAIDGDNPLKPQADPAMRERACKALEQTLALRVIKDRPRNEDKRCVCIFCGSLLTSNSIKLELHIAIDCVDDHPQVETMVLSISESKTATLLLGKEKLLRLKEKAEAMKPSTIASRKRPLENVVESGSTTLTERCRTGGSSISRCLDRELTHTEVAAIDEGIARWIFATGISFHVISSPYFRAALAKLNTTYLDKTTLTD